LVEIINGSLYQCDGDPDACDALIARGAKRVVLLDLCGLRVEQVPLRDGVVYIRWPIDDGPVPDRGLLSAVERLVAAAIEGGATVIAMCNMGRNRSGLIAALALMRLRSMFGGEAIEFVRSKNPEALSNEDFVRYLIEER
jgi:protein-tyrosine phosphatase